MGKITLVTGGTRSGKSFLAMQKALEYKGLRLFFATAVAFDQEMDERIKKHQSERADRFSTIETPYSLSEPLLNNTNSNASVILIDCLTVWIGNLMYRYPNQSVKLKNEINCFITTLQKVAVDCILVTNEVGMGIVPENKMAREFRDLAGMVNRKVAQCADEVYLSVCGIPLKIK